jgi:hypothetical protein
MKMTNLHYTKGQNGKTIQFTYTGKNDNGYHCFSGMIFDMDIACTRLERFACDGSKRDAISNAREHYSQFIA